MVRSVVQNSRVRNLDQGVADKFGPVNEETISE
jgi:hypothetical protein